MGKVFVTGNVKVGKHSVWIYIRLVGQVAQAARRWATGWTARVQSRVSEGWRFFFAPSCPDWS